LSGHHEISPQTTSLSVRPFLHSTSVENILSQDEQYEKRPGVGVH